MRESKEGGKERKYKACLFDLRSSVIRNSSSQERKFIYSTRATCAHKKKKEFTEDPNEGISGNQGFRARNSSYPCYYASRGRDSSHFGLFPPLGAVWLFFLI